MPRRLIPILGILTFSLTLQAVFFLHARQTPERDLPGSVWLVDDYDSERFAGDDIAAALPRAKAGNRRVLLFVGADWCGWCHRLSELMHQSEDIGRVLEEGYLVLKVAYSSRNAEYLESYPEFDEFPHLFILDGDGKLLASRNPAEFQRAGGYREAAVIEFLKEWAEKTP